MRSNSPGRRLSMRTRLLWGILLPVLAFVVINTVSLYRTALQSADTAYDRTLLASAKSIGEQLEVAGSGSVVKLKATVLYSALEPFEADNRSRMFYKVSGFAGEMVSGFEDDRLVLRLSERAGDDRAGEPGPGDAEPHSAVADRSSPG